MVECTLQADRKEQAVSSRAASKRQAPACSMWSGVAWLRLLPCHARSPHAPRPSTLMSTSLSASALMAPARAWTCGGTRSISVWVTILQ